MAGRFPATDCPPPNTAQVSMQTMNWKPGIGAHQSCCGGWNKTKTTGLDSSAGHRSLGGQRPHRHHTVHTLAAEGGKTVGSCAGLGAGTHLPAGTQQLQRARAALGGGRHLRKRQNTGEWPRWQGIPSSSSSSSSSLSARQWRRRPAGRWARSAWRTRRRPAAGRAMHAPARARRPVANGASSHRQPQGQRVSCSCPAARGAPQLRPPAMAGVLGAGRPAGPRAMAGAAHRAHHAHPAAWRLHLLLSLFVCAAAVQIWPSGRQEDLETQK